MDPAQVERLWEAHADALLLYATTLLSDRVGAEDVLQVVFLRLSAMALLPAPTVEASYLFKAVRNEALNTLRTRRRAQQAYERLFQVRATNGHLAPLPEDRSVDLQRALFEIPREQREAVVLKIWGDLSFEAAASVAGVSEKTFEHRYYRGLAALKNELDGTYE
jgi:RNA polymerase sigma factor (sigma-70 family)